MAFFKSLYRSLGYCLGKLPWKYFDIFHDGLFHSDFPICLCTDHTAVILENYHGNVLIFFMVIFTRMNKFEDITTLIGIIASNASKVMFKYLMLSLI